MKQANLISIIQAYENLDTETFNSFLKYHSIDIKHHEIESFQKLINELKLHTSDISLFDDFFIGYKIPQISKEFDLLRIGDDSIINIEMKRESSPNQITKQLERNKYYLGFLNKKIHCCTYVADEHQLYIINHYTKILDKINFRDLIEKLDSQKNIQKIKNLNSYFKPSNYLVSPFNSTEKFINKEYFLTSQQEEIKLESLREIRSQTYSIIAIKGKAGTGKTLLIYDIASEVISSHEKVLIIHCGQLNKGHEELKKNDWNIIPVKEIEYINISDYYLIIVDEAQRIKLKQLNFLIDKVKESSNNIIFSYDKSQTLRERERNNNVTEIIENEITTTKPYELTTKIRTNKEVASFIRCLFDNKKVVEKLNYENIEISYFNSINTAKKYLLVLGEKNWKIINYTPSLFNTEPYEELYYLCDSDNAHKVIGQEFDNVVAVVDKYFCYSKNGDLTIQGYNPYYDPIGMLFQIVTRTRIKLSIVIIDNQEILRRCLEIVEQR